MKVPIKHRWPIVLIVVSTLVIVVSSRVVFGGNDWAGLGQWIGGLGAFFAAWTALRIANGEVRREAARDKQRLRVHAHYVSGGWITETQSDKPGPYLEVRNRGTEPVLNVVVVAIHVRAQTTKPLLPLEVTDGPRHVLLPGEPWRPDWRPDPDGLEQALIARFMGPGGEVEIVFEDLGGTRWRRIGSRAPVVDDDSREESSP